MSRRPAVLSPMQLREAARAAVATAIAERTTALSEREARNVSGGGYSDPFSIGEPVLSGAVMEPSFPTLS